ncbi:GTP-binding protein [Anaerobacillus alkaliphilus]|uniref:GTP-binding protein n=1 Tax=Anaerobacillus alkaliphilus TaxID=1548597 RepID=A0A4Q0VMD9_9BACI|nr:tetratricopeptide repeat protein [Anaerobacillus alkaliphilus]RXI96214.1 GTP-binding protein [Anaerobacillus alkaliphilus]
MTLENELITKKYFETLLTDQTGDHPGQFLGSLFIDQQKHEQADLSDIRFSQGEVYFRDKDFEAAIFKWEKVENSLEQWARKNMGDAYFELGLFSKAIELYKSVATESVTLKSEVALKLFSIYKEQEKLDSAADVIKKAVSLNPDYPYVTESARKFFEEHRDWSSAIELAVNEAIRTERLEWFEVMNFYVDEGLTKPTPPDYFTKLLVVLYNVNHRSFEKLVVSLWESYKGEESYFSWVREIDRLFLQLEINPLDTWEGMSGKYHETYLELINGDFLIHEISDMIPTLLTNWLEVASSSHDVLAASSVLAWNETFEEAINQKTIDKAEHIIKHSLQEDTNLQQSIKLFKDIVKWSDSFELDIHVDQRLKWFVEKVCDLQTSPILLGGMSGSGKTSVIDSLLGCSNVSAPLCPAVFYGYGRETEIYEITNQSTQLISSLAELKEDLPKSSIVDVRFPSNFLLDHQISMVDIRDFDQKEELSFIRLADALLYVLPVTTVFTAKDRERLTKIQEMIPVHFLLLTDAIFYEKDASALAEKIRSRMLGYFPKANITIYSKHDTSSRQMEEMSSFIQTAVKGALSTEKRNEKLLFFVRETLAYLLKKRVETEIDLTETIRWKEDMVSKLHAAVHQVSDLEKEKNEVLQTSYRKMKEDMKQELKTNIPKLLSDCSALVNEERDFQTIHIDLNEQMNERIYQYVQHTILPRYSKEIAIWLEKCTEELSLSSNFLKEMAEGFTTMYKGQHFSFDCDFQVLDDWKRDSHRLSKGVRLDKMNIINRYTPSQLVLKSAGKLLGTLSNKTMLCNLYQKLIEKEDFEKIAGTITNQFMIQFELFEKGIERDISMFFSQSFQVLHEVIENEQQDIQYKKDALQRLKSNPEKYLDPIMLFNVRLLQYDLLQRKATVNPSYV